jgi:hypothetical protein
MQDIFTTIPSDKQTVIVSISEDGRGLFWVKCFQAEFIQVRPRERVQ